MDRLARADTYAMALIIAMASTGWLALMVLFAEACRLSHGEDIHGEGRTSKWTFVRKQGDSPEDPLDMSDAGVMMLLKSSSHLPQ
jgi:hypothetical protein